MTTEASDIVRVRIQIPEPHSHGQLEFVRDTTLRKICKAGRRWGKTVGVSIISEEAFLGVCPACGGEGCSGCDNTGKVRPKRVLYAAPTAEQVTKFWFEVSSVLLPGIEAGIYKKDETEHTIEVPGTETRIKAKTAWNANTLRGDWGDLVILEEYQLWNEDAWQDVVQPMLLDTNGTAIFIFTPSSLKSEGVSKAKDPRHASKMFKKYQDDKSGRWKTFHFTTFENPTLSKDALKELTESGDMSSDSYRREILAEDEEIETSWLVYGTFDETMCKIQRFTIPPHWPVYSGHDFGISNPAALFVAQVILPLPAGVPAYLRYGDYIAFAEYTPGGGHSPRAHVDEFTRITKGMNLTASTGGNVTTEEDARQLYRREGWNIMAPAVNRVNVQIDHVIALMEQKQFYIFDDLYQLLYEIDGCLWVLDEQKRTTNKIQNESRYHLLACLRYLGTLLNTRVVANDETNETRWDDEDDTEIAERRHSRRQYELYRAGR